MSYAEMLGKVYASCVLLFILVVTLAIICG